MKSHAETTADFADIAVGDLVKVHDLDNPRDEYVEFVAKHPCGGRIYGLSDGSWVTEPCVSKYAAQGDERRNIIDKLNEVI